MALENGVPVYSKDVPKDHNKPTDEDFDAFWNTYTDMYKGTECAVHFRMRTSGNIDVENAHPYVIGNDVLLMHNGVITRVPEKYKEFSDTWHVGALIQPMAEAGWLNDDNFMEMLTHLIGSGNKLVLLDKDGFHFVNKEEGTEFGGLWYSNTYAWTHPEYQKFYIKYKNRMVSQNQHKEVYTGTDSKVYLADGTVWDIADEESNVTIDDVVDNMGERLTAKVLAGMTPEEEEETMREIEDEYNRVKTLVESDTLPEIKIPTTIVEWADLDLTQIIDIAMEEPEEVAEALYTVLQR
jgi:hypothetical protein